MHLEKNCIHLHAVLILVYVIVPQHFNLQNNNKVYSILTKDCHTWGEKMEKMKQEQCGRNGMTMNN